MKNFGFTVERGRNRFTHKLLRALLMCPAGSKKGIKRPVFNIRDAQ